MQAVYAFLAVATAALLHIGGAHVSLTSPPARFPNYDFLDNVRTGGPCGVPDKPTNPITTYLSGSTINITYHLGYPHRGGILVNLLAPNGTILFTLLGTQWQFDDDATQNYHEVTFPEGFVCERCTLQLLRQAREWSAVGGYIFWNCADISLVDSPSALCNNMTCSGHGTCDNGKCTCDRLYSGDFCEFKDECADRSDCSQHGICIDIKATSHPRKQCYCDAGWFGEKCAKVSSLVNATIDPTKYTITRTLSDRLTMYALIDGDEIEVALRHAGSSYVALGWRPQGLVGSCQFDAPGPFPVGAHALWPNGQTFPLASGDDLVIQGPEEGGPEEGAPEEGAPEEGAPEEGAPEEGAPEEGAPEEGAPEEGAPEEGAPEEGAPEEGAPEEGAPEEGTGPLHPMDCTDIVIGTARGRRSRIYDYYTRDRSTPRMDSFYGGEDDIVAAVGQEVDGITMIKWRKKITTDDKDADHALVDELMHVIWSFGQVYPDYYHAPGSSLEAGTASNERFYQPDELKYHGTRNRGVVTLNFFQEDQPEGNDKCTGNFQTSDYSASWTVNGDEKTVTFTVSAKRTPNSVGAEWVAIGFSPDQFMPNSDAVVGAADGSGSFVTDRFITARAPPPEDSSNDLTDVEATFENGVTTMKFTRQLTTPDSAEDFSLEECQYFLFGWGGVADISARTIQYHPNTPIVSSDKICLQECSGGIDISNKPTSDGPTSDGPNVIVGGIAEGAGGESVLASLVAVTSAALVAIAAVIA